MLACAACGDRAQFQPTQNVTSVSPSGQPAASYSLRADQTSSSRITVNVWSDGAARQNDRTYINVSVELRNTSDAPIALDRGALQLEPFNSEGAPLPAARLIRVRSESASYAVGPGDASTMRLLFELPVPVAPGDLGALRFRWGIERDDGERYLQFTDFRQPPDDIYFAGMSYYDPIYGFYDPFFYGAPYGYHFNYYVPVGRATVNRGAVGYPISGGGAPVARPLR